ncbi:MAG TPA: hypothetical protein VGP93_16470 [Polyangiaceae bacterium]|nr:hypothetical protein [Polyangiaceae bacterium]
MASIEPDSLLDACVARVVCDQQALPALGTRLQKLSACIADVEWSAERAIPLSGYWHFNERAEYWVSCALDSAGDCSMLADCTTERASGIYCEEDGCRLSSNNAVCEQDDCGVSSANGSYEVSCTDTIATLGNELGTSARDCSRAFAECDLASPTGCTDRLFSQCTPDATERCEGDVRIGCDGSRQVSYRDCSRLGGHCALHADKHFGCSYGDATDESTPICTVGTPSEARCDGDQLSLCAAGFHLTRGAPEICCLDCGGAGGAGGAAQAGASGATQSGAGGV